VVVALRVRQRAITPGLEEATNVRYKRDEAATGEMCNQWVTWAVSLATAVEADGVAELGCA
jgi:hypothetical protein